MAIGYKLKGFNTKRVCTLSSISWGDEAPIDWGYWHTASELMAQEKALYLATPNHFGVCLMTKD